MGDGEDGDIIYVNVYFLGDGEDLFLITKKSFWEMGRTMAVCVRWLVLLVRFTARPKTTAAVTAVLLLLLLMFVVFANSVHMFRKHMHGIEV